MKRVFTLLTFSLMTWAIAAQNGTISGIITGERGEPLIGASVLAEGTTIGTVSDEKGNYALSVPAGSYTLRFTYLGYETQEVPVTIAAGQRQQLNLQLAEGRTLDVVVVSGSRRPEKLTESAATIETIFAREIEEYAGNPAELIARQKGVDYFRAGIATPAFNIRGFNSNFNAKNLQVTDSRFSSLVATGLPLGPLSSTIKEDIERIELILGPNATMYGPNAHNGLLNTITKDPRTSEGTTLVVNPGVNGDGNAFFSGRFRHAQVLNDKFAFKIMGEYLDATEFEFSDSVYITRNGVRDAYNELELDNSVNFLRGEAALYYAPTSNLDIIFNTGHSRSNYLAPTNVGRNQIKDWDVSFYQLRVAGKKWFAQAYYTQSSTDSTYAIDQRTKNYYALLNGGLSDQEARGPLSYGNGALFQDNSNRLNAEAQYNDQFGRLGLVTGVQYQLDRANSLGSYLLDNDGFIEISQVGGYAHLTYDFRGGWRAIAAARADYHEVYEFNFVPKMGLLRIGDRGTWRLTYGQGIAAPTILNMYGNLFAGLILGNAEGFTLADGTVIDRQRVEKIQTFELGYRGQVVPSKLFIDANAYYNISRDFLSPLTVLGVATLRGDTPVQDLQAGFNIYNGLVASYVNFGEVFTYGADFGATYYINNSWSAFVNYSYFDWSVDEDNLEDNDFNNDGVVNFLDILVNAPTHKIGFGINHSSEKWFGSLFGRWVQAYDYFSSFQIASRTHEGLTYRGVPIVENARSADAFNYGPLGGFVTFDFTIGHRFNDKFTLAATAVNMFNQELREFTASAPTRGLYMLEFKVNLPALKKK
jgi:outer membrane receptor for ferrienterochelin and colicins